MKLILLGNDGAGKSTMARRIVSSGDTARLSLDEIAWGKQAERKPLEASLCVEFFYTISVCARNARKKCGVRAAIA